MATVVGLFRSEAGAEQAINDLKAAGYDPNEIGVVAQNKDTSKTIVDNTDVSDAGVAAGAGAVEGTIVGGALAALIATGTIIALPVVGPLALAGSALAWTAAGAGIGAATGALAGGLLGALTEAGVDEEEARYYQTAVGEGGILVTVNSSRSESETRSLLMNAGAESLQNNAGGLSSGTSSTTYSTTSSGLSDTGSSSTYATGTAAYPDTTSNVTTSSSTYASGTDDSLGDVARDALPDGDQLAGGAQETFGNVKRGVGDALGNNDLRASGTADVIEGGAQRVKGDIENEMGDRR